ncbi:hypothetical protein T11_2642 [Trichinella zimbabwensis]|uniref:Uncharacterized protein n=1 Tax=Trichinella zimbabwensis TaxID=268475 RepID=A0A0V1HKR9_9BILA|nr:hypothetical protein T11_2642 [Trichinella zimbabwensis]
MAKLGRSKMRRCERAVYSSRVGVIPGSMSHLARISMHLSKVGNYIEFELYFVVPALLADLQFGLGLSDLCCFCENMTELSQDLRQLLCE